VQVLLFFRHSYEAHKGVIKERITGEKTCKSKMYAIIKREKLGITLTSFNPPHFCACPKPRPGFPT
jgi:hypothetical protein